MELTERGQLDISEIKEGCDRFGIGKSQLSEFCRMNYDGLSEMTVGRIFNGKTSATYPELKRMKQVLDDCAELVRRSGGAPLNWGKTADVKKLLAALEEERTNPPTEPTSSDWSLFTSRDSGEPIESIADRLGVSVNEAEARILAALYRIDFKIESFKRNALEIVET